MSTSLGTAYIEIQADWDSFNRRTLPEVQRRLGGISTSQTKAATTTSRLSQATSGLGGSLARAAGAAAGAAAAYISISQAKEAITATNELAKSTLTLQANLGVATKEASRWAVVARARGVDMKGLAQAFGILSKNIDAATHGGTEQLEMFKRLGLSMQDLKSANSDWSGFVTEFSDGLGKMGSGSERTALMMKTLGRGWLQIAPLMRDGADALKEQLALADKYHVTFGQQALDDQEKLIAAQRESQMAWMGLQVAFTRSVTPALIDAHEKFQNLAKMLTDPALSDDEKFRRLAHKIEHWADAARDAFIGILPTLAEKAGETGPKIAKALAEGFINSNALGKIFLTGSFIRMVGGPGALGRIGVAMGGQIAAGAAGGAAASKWTRMGTLAGRMVGPAMGLSIVAMLATDPAVQKAIKDMIAGEPLGAPNREQFAVKANEMFDGAVGYESFLGREKVKIETALGSLIFNARTEKLVKAQNDKLAKLVGEDMGAVFQKYAKMSDGVTGQMSRGLDRANAAVKKHARTADKGFGDAGGAWSDYAREGDKDSDKIEDSLDRTGDKTKKQGKTFETVWDGVSKRSGKLARNVTANNANMTNAVGEGLGVLRDNVLAATKEFGVKSKITYSIKKADKAVTTVTNLLGAQKGAVVPGAGSGDTVPLHIGGQLAAMVEPGELVSVANRKATGALMNLNRAVPRFATGGMVDPAGPGTGIVNEAIAKVVGAWSKRYNAAINYGYDPGGGHLSPGHNVTGTATDTGPAAGWGEGPTALFEKGLELLVNSGLTVLYGSHGVGTPYPNHGYGNHAHIEWGMHPEIRGLSAAAAETIKRILLKGPRGSLRSMGQSALDKARKAANAYIRKNSGGMMGGDIGAPIRSLPKALQKYNRTYPVSSGFGDGYAMPFNAVAALAEWSGTPGVSMARTAIGESQLEPGAKGYDPGGSIGWGLQMITTGVGNDAMINALGGGPQMLNPVKNEMAAKKIWDSAGWGAWYSGTKDTSNTHYTGPLLRRLGGLVPHLKGGSKKPLGGALSGGFTDPAWIRFRRAQRIAQHIADVLGDKGSVARLDERIGIAETNAGLASSPGGSEMTAAELAMQIGLNERLLETMARARKGIREGMGLTNLPKGMSVDKETEKRLRGLRGTFGEQLVGLVGVTGKGGRIYDVRTHLDELRHTTSSGSAPMDISQLRSVIEAARFGAFNGLPKFHEGGVVPGPRSREVPIMARGGELVSPGGNTYIAEIDLGNGVRQVVDLEFRQRERITRHRERQYQQ